MIFLINCFACHEPGRGSLAIDWCCWCRINTMRTSAHWSTAENKRSQNLQSASALILPVPIGTLLLCGEGGTRAVQQKEKEKPWIDETFTSCDPKRETTHEKPVTRNSEYQTPNNKRQITNAEHPTPNTESHPAYQKRMPSLSNIFNPPTYEI